MVFFYICVQNVQISVPSEHILPFVLILHKQQNSFSFYSIVAFLLGLVAVRAQMFLSFLGRAEQAVTKGLARSAG